MTAGQKREICSYNCFFLCVGKGNRIKRGGSLHNEVEKNPGAISQFPTVIYSSHRLSQFATVIHASHGLSRFIKELFLSRDSSFDPLIMEYFITRLVFRPSGQREAMRIRGYAGLRLSFAKINKNH